MISEISVGTTATQIPFSPHRKTLNDFRNNESKFEDGYDSDGAAGPFFDCLEEEGDQIYEEEDLDLLDAMNAMIMEDDKEKEGDVVDVEEEEEVPKHVPIADNILVKLKVAELRLELRMRNCPVSGKKPELVCRLREALAKEIPVNVALQNKETDTGKEKLNQIFHPTAFWKELQCEKDATAEPENPTFNNAYAPTMKDAHATTMGGGNDYIPLKHNFTEIFERQEFDGKYEEVEKFANGTIKKHRDGSPILKVVRRTRGKPNLSFVKKHQLSSQSHPADFVEAFLPFRKNRLSDGSNKKYVSIELMTKWTNLKAELSGAGDGGTIHRDFRRFSPKELRQHLGLYIFNGLSPAPRVEYKFRPHSQDAVHGNDFIYHSFGPNAERRHRHFKTFLAAQDPAIAIPQRKLYPNWKVRPLLKWMNHIFKEAWWVGEYCAVDEMTIGFQGMHADKRRITYKAEGDGFQADALCDDGYCYQFYFRNHPAPKKYLEKGLSPLHSRVMTLFDTLTDKYHICGMDNLYNSAAFCKHAYTHKNKVKVHGVTRKGMRGIPKCVKQEELSNKQDQLNARGTVTAAVLVGDDECPDLLATCVYDTKPVHFLSMVCKLVKWILCEKKVFNVDTGLKESMKFLRLGHIHTYNQEMGDVDIADQYRNVYRFDHWMRKRKWWWAIFFWAIGVILVNAYILYIRLCEEEGIPKRYIMSHHDFRKKVAMAWINSDVYWTGEKHGPVSLSHKRVKRKRLCLDTGATTLVKEKKQRTERIMDQFLGPWGPLRIRLDTTKPHLATKAKGHARCGLHRWVGIETQSQISYCETCNVNLCTDCFKYFHVTEDILSQKKSLQRKYEKEREKKWPKEK